MTKLYHSKLLVSLLLIVAILVAYWQVKNFDFVGFDDKLYITENRHVQAGLTVEGVIWAFTTFHSANWHPLTWLSHMLDCELYGLNPAGHHWTNVQFHIANTLLLFFILQPMTGAPWRSAFVAALFAMHPLHVESVAWVAERKDVLSTFFGLLAILSYYRYVKHPGHCTYLLMVLFFGLGLMAKPMLVTLPFVLLLLDFWPLKRVQYKNTVFPPDSAAKIDLKGSLKLLYEKIPLFILVAISSVLTFIAQQSWGAVRSLESFTIKDRIFNAIVSYVGYVVKTIWPHKLSVFYPYPEYTRPAWQILGLVLLIAAAILWAVKRSKHYPYIAVGLFWYLGTLVPVIGLVQVGFQAMADRYTYIPLTGLFIIVSWGTFDLLEKWYYRKYIIVVSALLILSLLTLSTFCHLGNWQNGITLFEHAIEVTRKNCLAHNNLGVLLYKQNKIDAAIFQYDEVLKIKPHHNGVLYNKGCALIKKGDLDKAAFLFKELLRVRPDYAQAHNKLAYILFVQGRLDEAVLHYRNALKIKPDFGEAYNNLANVLFFQGKLNEAALFYKEAIRIDPWYIDTYYHIGLLFKKQGRLKEAMVYLGEAIKIDPDYAKAYNEIGLILFRQGKYKKSGVFFSKAIQIKPDYEEAIKNLAIVQKKLSSG